MLRRRSCLDSLRLCLGRRRQLTDYMDDVHRWASDVVIFCCLSFVVEIRHLVRGHAITTSMSQRLYLGQLSVLVSGYGYSSMMFFPVILLR